MPNLISLCNVCLIVGLFVVLSNGFPDGAPPDTCVKDRFNQPNHGKARTQELSTLPFQVVASSAYYGPGQSISCKQQTNKSYFACCVYLCDKIFD